jgi:hypothetical protein
MLSCVATALDVPQANTTPMPEFMLSVQYSWGLYLLGLRSIYAQFVTDISGQHVSPIFKDQDSQLDAVQLSTTPKTSNARAVTILS